MQLNVCFGIACAVIILRTYLSLVLLHCWLGHLTRKNPSLIWPVMCLVGR